MPNEAMPKTANVAPEPKKGGVLGLIIAILALVAAVVAIMMNVVMKPDTSALEARVATLEGDIKNAETMMQAEEEEENGMMETDTSITTLDTSYELVADLTHASISYPHSWFAERAAGTNQYGQQELILTSQRGQLVYALSSGGPIPAGVEYFENGAQINITRIETGNEAAAALTTEETGTPNLMRVTDVCDGAGCPGERYIFKNWYIEIRSSDDTYKELADNVVSSLK